REDEDHTDSVAEPNLRTIKALRMFVISSDSSHHSGTNVEEAEVDYLIRSFDPIMTTVTITTAIIDPTSVTKEKVVEPSLFGASSSLAGGVFSQILPAVIYFVTNGSRLKDGHICREMVDEFSPLKFFASVRGMKHDRLFTEYNVRAARQMSLSTDVWMRAEYNVKEKRRLKYVVESQGKLLKAREEEIRSRTRGILDPHLVYEFMIILMGSFHLEQQ
nr:hypothetical protein [Tanacetum cinerariifolium]